MLLPCSRVEADRDSERRDRAGHPGGENFLRILYSNVLLGNYREINFPKTRLEAFPEQGSSAGACAMTA